ncbi:hypothetical protein [Candidatus Tisiphia endosymbiont of Beris chalybata]|uniref:hypothetical protein n=1 Tax=Candidatus Tisiphia endosymbiont of Beris chalybata TaxID=3066262 RepID=UPI00312CB140
MSNDACKFIERGDIIPFSKTKLALGVQVPCTGAYILVHKEGAHEVRRRDD